MNLINVLFLIVESDSHVSVYFCVDVDVKTSEDP